MSDFQTAANLDYNKMKVKAGVIGGLFAGKKIKRANQEIQNACNQGNPDIQQANGDEVVYKNGQDVNDDGLDVFAATENEASDGTVKIAEGNDNIDAGEIYLTLVDEFSNTAVYTMETFMQMEEEALANGDEATAAMLQNMQVIDVAMLSITANGLELESLMAELLAIYEEEQGGEFSTNMAAAGGENSAYSLNIPTGGNQQTGKADEDQSGLIHSTKFFTQTQGNAQSQGASNMPSTSAQRTQEIFARIYELQAETNAWQSTVENSFANIQSIQVEVGGFIEPQQEMANEQVAQDTEKVSTNQEIMEVFDKITTTGNTITTAGLLTKSVGAGMNTAGVGMEVAGTSMKLSSNILKGISGGLKALAAGLLGGVYTAPAGSVVATGAATVNGSSVALDASGTAVDKAGKTLKTAGNTVITVGTGMQVAGKATSTVGSGGTMACKIAEGDILGAVMSGMQFLASAAGCIGDMATFSANLGQAASGFAETMSKVNEKFNKAFSLGNMNASQTLQKASNFTAAVSKGGFINAAGQFAADNIFNDKGDNESDTFNDTYKMQSKEKEKLKALGASDQQIANVKNSSDYDKLVAKLEAAKNGENK